MEKKLILGASIGNCVHVAGISHFLQIAENEGYQTIFLGPAVSVEKLFENINKYKPEMVSISYRLTKENAKILLDQINEKRKELDYNPIWEFGGTKPVADIAKEYGFFSYISDGFDDISDSIRFLRGEVKENSVESYGKNIIDRIQMSYPYPVLRHHFGLPSIEETIEGVKKIAESKVLDVISLGPDQNAQQFFFQPDQMQKQFDGAGGVPIRTKEDFENLKAASQCGNYPLMRCYSGTSDVFDYAKLLNNTIDNAWTAIPLFWYNELDGRGERPIEQSIREAQELIKWHAEQNIPVEINEPHHWGLRDSHDVMPVVMCFISAYNAKRLGVKNYIAQFMFNNPNGLSFSMDFARILAMIEIIKPLEDENFKIYRETRAGLPLFNADPYVAKGQLAASTFLQMAVKPHIVHVVGYCEANHAATAEDVIESCKIVKGVIRHTLEDSFSIQKDEKIVQRKDELLREASYLINFIMSEYAEYTDPLTNPDVLAECVKLGYFDAVHILKNDKFKGNLETKFQDGKCLAWDSETNTFLTEAQRLEKLKQKNKVR